ncbi:MAG TPA: tetratricopeptide repeat protein [Candidatus Angelobacter sp.]
MKVTSNLLAIQLSLVLSVPLFAKGSAAYEQATLISVTDATRIIHITLTNQGGAVSVNRPLVAYHLNVAVGDVVYIGNYRPHTRWTPAPTDLIPNSTVEMRLEDKCMYLKRSNGHEIKATIVSRIDKADDDKVSGDTHKAAEKHHQWGKELYGIGDREGAIKQLKMALLLSPDDDTFYDLDIMLRQAGYKGGALEELQSAVRLNASDVKAHCLLGWIFHDKEHLESAIGEWQTAVQLDPKFSFAHYSYGVGLEDKGELPKALEEYRIAVQLDHNQSEAKRGVVRVGNKMAMTATPESSSGTKQ